MVTRKTVTKFESHGVEFGDAAAAKTHDAEVGTLNRLTEVLHASITTGRLESVIKHFVLEHEEIRRVLTVHKKRLPRVKDTVEELAVA